MLFRSSAHLLYAALATVLVAAVSFLVIDLGIYDAIFHTETKEPFRGLVGKLRDSNIDVVIKSVALAVTIIFGMIGALTAWHYQEINLGPRLVDLINRIKNAHLHDRAVMIAPYASLHLNSVPSPYPAAPRRWWQFAKRDENARAATALLDSAPTIDNEIEVLDTQLNRWKSERITAHLIKGLQVGSKANSLEAGSAAQLSQRESALEEFREALKLIKDDVDALEHAAKVAKLVSLQGPAKEYLERMEGAAAEQRRTAKQARALRFQAELFEEGSTDTPLNRARVKLEAAIAVLAETGDAALTTDLDAKERLIERALANEQLARLQLRRGKYTRVRGPLDEAERCYKTMPPPDGPAGLDRIEVLKTDLTRAEQGGDEPDDPEAAETIPLAITHVTNEPVSVSKELNGGGAVIGELTPFTGVALVRVENGWAEIAKEGQSLGFVEETKLHKLN